MSFLFSRPWMKRNLERQSSWCPCLIPSRSSRCSLTLLHCCHSCKLFVHFALISLITFLLSCTYRKFMSKALAWVEGIGCDKVGMVMQQRATRAQANLNNMSIRPTTWSVRIKNKGRSFCLALSDKSKKNANKFELFTLSQQSRAIPSIVWWKHSRRKDQSDCHALWKLRKRGVIIE